MLYGTLSFAIVSTLAYSLWAFRLVRGEALLFTAIAVVYLPPIWTGREAVKYPYLFFASLPCSPCPSCSTQLPGAVMVRSRRTIPRRPLRFRRWTSRHGLVLPSGFGATKGLLASFSILFAFHTLGYYAGEVCYAEVGRKAGRLLWALVTDWDSEPA